VRATASTPWPQVPIGTIAEIYDGPHATPKPSDEGPIFLGIKNITEDGHLDLSEIRHIGEDDYPRWIRRVEPRSDDIVFIYEAGLNRYAIIPQSFRGCLGRRTALIRLDRDRADPRFLLYYFLGDEWHQTIARNIWSGATVDRIPLTNFPAFPVRLPPLPTQRKIAAILSAYDDLIENNTRRIAILEEMARLLYREWFVHFRFPGHESVRMVDSPLGPFPKGWEVRNFGDVALNFDSKRIPLSSMTRHAMQGSYPYYGAAKVLDHVNDYIFDGLYLLIAEDGSVITAGGRPVLQRVAGRFWANNHTHVIQGKPPVTTNFLYLVMSDYDISGHITGAAQPKITQQNLNRILVPVPTEPLLRRFETLVAGMFELVDALVRENSTLCRTRDLLLPRLITGELDIGDAPLGGGEEDDD
jgi:type I restriction enzyme S subunit